MGINLEVSRGGLMADKRGMATFSYQALLAAPFQLIQQLKCL